MLRWRSPAENTARGRNTDFNILVHLLHSKLFGGTVDWNRSDYVCG
ncbi:UNVERIFIED_CONTAM: hypothetical protein ABIE34_001888 [Jeotgalibacillus campisalis]